MTFDIWVRFFFLDVGFECISERMSKSERAKRPLFADITEARRLYNERKKIYEKQAHYVVSGVSSITESARQIIECAEQKHRI